MHKPEKESIRSRLHISDLIPRIVCIAIALTIWLYVMSNNSPDYERTFSGVTVEITDAARLSTEKNLSVIQGYGTPVDITVAGKKSDIISYSLDDIVASIDVGEVDAAGKHSLRVSVAMPDGCVLKSVRPSNVEVYVDELSVKAIPVKVNLTSVQYDHSISLGTITPDVSTVTVSGPISVIDGAKEAVVDLELGTVTTGVAARGTLKVVNESGTVIDNPYLVLSQTSVGVTIPVYTERTLPVKIAMKHGYLHEGNSTVEIVPKEITVRADPKILEGMSEVTVATLDETKFANDTTQIMRIQLPEGIENVSGTETVTISVRHKNTVKKSLVITAIRLENPNKLNYVAGSESINVTLRAPADVADDLIAAEFSASGELNYSNTQGIVQVPLTVVVPTKYKDSVYAVGEYAVAVKVEQ